eukprot:UN10455
MLTTPLYIYNPFPMKYLPFSDHNVFPTIVIMKK